MNNAQAAKLLNNQPEDFNNLSGEQKDQLLEWIKSNLQKIKTINKNHTSYGLKHYFEYDKKNGGFYVTNGQFKGAMLECGFIKYEIPEIFGINWEFNVSEKSISKLKKRGVHG